VIKRYSLAVRQESAPAEDLLAALDESRDAVLAALGTVAKKTARRSTSARSTTSKTTSTTSTKKRAGAK
jgi:hypothetical protein